jgi:hypothetical protein
MICKHSENPPGSPVACGGKPSRSAGLTVHFKFNRLRKQPLQGSTQYSWAEAKNQIQQNKGFRIRKSEAKRLISLAMRDQYSTSMTCNVLYQSFVSNIS